MPGIVIIVIVCCVALPVAVLMSGGVMAAVLGWFLTKDVEHAHEGSELIDLNR